MKLPTFPDKYDDVQRAVLQQFRLDPMGVHGLPHWVRTYRNGLLIAAMDPKVEIDVVACFALLHDSCRENEFDDPMHGLYASRFAARLWNEGAMPYLSEEQLTTLKAACLDHTLGFTNQYNPTIQACWDADRLDLGRVGIKPNPQLLGSKYGLLPDTPEKHWEESWNVEGMEAMIEAV